jgi:hypothetical protein
LILAFAASCTDSEQQAQIERQKRIEQQEKDDAARASEAAKNAQSQGGAGSSDTSQVEPEASPTPDATQEPDKTTNYIYFNGNSKVVCICRKSSECGMTFWGCDDGKVYGCMHNAVYQPVEVEATNDNTSNCEE